MGLTVEKCLQAWTNSLRQMKAKADIVFFGDSLTYYGDFSSVFPDKVVCNLGLRGDTIQGMIDRVEQVKMLEPDTVYVMAGINDVGIVSHVHFNTLYESLVQNICELIPYSKIIIQSLLPVDDTGYTIRCKNEDINEANIAIRRIADEYKCTYYDLFALYNKRDNQFSLFTTDGIHLKSEGYSAWYGVLKDNI